MTTAHAFAVLSTFLVAAFAAPVSEPVNVAEPPTASAGAIEAKRIFNQRCEACHTYGKGPKVGPDLKGVTARRERVWLLGFIRSSQTVIRRGDPIARRLFAQFNEQRMPDWTDLSDLQIASILNWFEANGPEQKEPDERDATLATREDIAMGRNLFTGQLRLANGGLACINCHVLRVGNEVASIPLGGTLGPDLTASFFRYQDRAMTLFLKRSCFPRVPEQGRYLRPLESFALKALLRQASLSLQRVPAVVNAPGPSLSAAGKAGKS